MPKHLKFIIETDSLAKTNPAVVSRIPIVTIEDSDI